MYSHIMVGSNDVKAAQKFYDAVFDALGVGPAQYDAVKDRIFYAGPTGIFIVTRPIDGEPATFANGGTIGFACHSAEQVDQWHAAGVANGGTSCEDPPGFRSTARGDLYLAYLRDPAGNKLCAAFPR